MPFKVIKKKENIVLLGTSAAELKERIQTLIQYTKQFETQAVFGELSIQSLTPEISFFKKGFTHSVTLNSILPRHLKALYGSNSYTNNGNCHGAACYAAGIYPALTTGYKVAMDVIEFDNLSIGDVVSLKGLDHSFLFLDNELCISMNGAGASLEIQPLQNVLEIYKALPSILTKEHSAKITIYRKPKNCYSPEELLGSMYALFELISEGGFYQLPSDKKYPRVKEVSDTFRKKIQTLIDNETDCPTRCNLQHIDSIVRAPLPYSMLVEVKEVPSENQKITASC